MTYNLETGYVVKFRSGELRIVSRIKYKNKNVSILLNTLTQEYSYLAEWNHDLKFNQTSNNRSPLDIMYVYGFVEDPYEIANCNNSSKKGRPLLWKRDEPFEMTLSELEKILGFKVRIVEETK